MQNDNHLNAALNYWLIRKGGSGETLEDVIGRYRCPAVFAAMKYAK